MNPLSDGSAGETGQDVNAAVNAIYRRMTAAYAGLDLALLATVYDENCLYLSREREVDAALDRNAFWPMFVDLFGQKRQGGETISITFRVIRRTVLHGGVHDVGYYRRRDISPDGARPPGHGKFSTLCVPRPDGGWCFAYDGDVPATAAAYENASPFPGAIFDP
jgi:hypothetical protein